MLMIPLLTACLIGGIFSVLLAGILSITMLAHQAHRMVAFAVGVLLGFAFTDLLPEALRLGITLTNAGWVLVCGILIFFILEKLALWRHAHQALDAIQHQHPEVSIILLGDGIHNFVDGILLAAAFMTDTKLGWVTALAITIHEIPQEISDFMVLMHAGLSKKRAILLNMLSGSAMLLGGLVGWFGFSHISHLIPHALLLAAASFFYIALADLVPSLHKHAHPKDLVIQSSLLFMGLGVAGISPFLQTWMMNLWRTST